MKTLFAAPLLIALTFPAFDAQKNLEEKVRKQLVELSNYGVFDFLQFRIDGGHVALLGYVDNASLKSDAERAVKRVEGVETVENEIQVLPVSRIDDGIRRALFNRIYQQPALSRYAAGGGLLRHDPFNRPPFGWANTPSNAFEPGGNYAIHIIVNNGNVILAGNVDSKMDKDIAGITANGMAGVFSVDNQLVVGS